MRTVVVTLGVLLSLAAVLLAVVAGGLFLDGEAGAGGLAVFFVMVTLLSALLLFRTVPRAAALPARRPRRQPDSGFYYGDATPVYGADRSWSGDGGADPGHPGSGHGSGYGSGHSSGHGSGHGGGHWGGDGHGHTSGGDGGWGGGSDSGSSSSGSDGGSGGSDGGSSGGSD